MKRQTKAVLLGTAGAVLSAAAIREGIARAIDRNMVEEALERQEPKAMIRLRARLTGYGKDPTTVPVFRALREALEETPHETVALQSYDGTGLVGHLFPVENPKRVVIAMHGWRSSWAKDFCMIADFLRENQCTVLYAEQRGQGESQGAYMGFGMIERYDCLEWIRWANDHGFAHLPIYLAGISMGATTVLMTTGFSELPENVVGCVADCGFTSARAEWQHISEQNLHMSYRRHRKRVDALCRKRIDLDSDAYSTLDAMAVCKTPVLFIHGEADTFVPADMSRENFAACAAPKKLLTVPGANHGMSYVLDQEGYEKAVLEFWAENDGRTAT